MCRLAGVDHLVEDVDVDVDVDVDLDLDLDLDLDKDVDVEIDHLVQDPIHLLRRVPAFLRFLKHRVLQAALAHLDVLVHQHPEVLVLGDQPPHVLQRLVVPCLQVDNLSLETFMKPSNVNL